MTIQTLPTARKRSEMTPDEKNELYRVMKACDTKKPKASDVAALQAYLRSDPTLWREIADLARQTAEDLMRQVSNDRGLITESLRRGREVMLHELGYEQASGLERLLCESVYLTWLRYTDTERQYSAVMAGSLTITQATWWEKRLSGSQRRYLRACETLARIRKMQLPMLQVNIAQQQVNVANAS